MAPSVNHSDKDQDLDRPNDFTFSTDYDSSAAEDSYLTHYDSPECALLAYARLNKLDKLRSLLQAKQRGIKLDLNVRGRQRQNQSWSALHLASYFGNVQIARELLKYPEIDVNIQNNAGDTPLHKAALTRRVDIVHLLIEHKADILIQNNEGKIPKQLTEHPGIINLIEAAEPIISRITKQSVKRFEGPLMRKVRFLGWRPIYGVLENGLFLIFNNRNDSMNKSPRGYKYLESASLEPDPVNIGVFSLRFSDGSRVLLSVPARTSHELARKKWIEAISEHIQFSTKSIQKGFYLNEDEEDDYGASLNLLLQEAKIHQKILERHFQSLTTLIEGIAADSIASRRTNGIIENRRPQSRHSVSEASNNQRLQALHMLARDHHELEKSITTSVLARTVSISTVNTDLNEYFDAFEDFDDEKTVTPSCMPSDDEIEDIPSNLIVNNAREANTKTTMEEAYLGLLVARDIDADEDSEDNSRSALTEINDTDTGVEIAKDVAALEVMVQKRNRSVNKRSAKHSIGGSRKVESPLEHMKREEAVPDTNEDRLKKDYTSKND